MEQEPTTKYPDVTRAVRTTVGMPISRGRVYLMLVSVMDQDGFAEMPMDMLAHITGLSRKTLRSHLAALEDDGLLYGKNTPRYRVHIPDMVTDAREDE